MNWTVLILVGLVLLALVIFLILRNLKDEEDFEEKLDHDTREPHKDEEDTDDAAVMH